MRLILSNNGAAGDTPAKSGMGPKRSTSGAAGYTPDAVTTRLGMPKSVVAARHVRMPSTGFEASTPERPMKRSGRAQAAGTPLPAHTARAAVAKEALCTLKSLQPHAMEWAKAAGTSFSSREMAEDAMSAAVDSLGVALSDLDLQRALGMSADDFDQMSNLAGELRMQSKRFERGDPELLANASRMEAAKVALSTFKSVQPHAMERAEVHGTSFSSQGMGDAMNAAVRRRCQHSGHRAHAAHKCCAQQRACIRAMSGGISRGHDRPGRAKHALTPKREE